MTANEQLTTMMAKKETLEFSDNSELRSYRRPITINEEDYDQVDELKHKKNKNKRKSSNT